MIDKSWTLFLDRDGVINVRLPGDYVKSLDQFKFIEGTPEAITICTKIFGKIIVVSNQQGIGKGLMTLDQVELIHNEIRKQLTEMGGKIDKFLISPYLHSQNHFSRKPSVGMGLQAKKEFRDISFRKSIMVGDSLSDMLFGKRLGMKTVFIGNYVEIKGYHSIIDYCCSDLLSFAYQVTAL